MPFYEYECQDCGHRLEVLQKISDEPLTICPSCNRSALKKLISAAAFHLKGTGWYETDFKHSGKKPAAEESKSGEGAGEKKDSDKSETSKSDKSGETKAA